MTEIPYTYVVKFLHLEERTKDEFEYSNLLDALRVIKETPIDGVTLSQVRFETDLILLLTSTFMYAGKKNAEYPEGCVMLMLHKRENGVDSPVYGTQIVPFVAGYNLLPPPVAKSNFPSQRDSWDPVREKQDMLKLNSTTETYPILKLISPVAETNMGLGWGNVFIQGDQNPETD